jgi:hypothetical protein
MRLCLAVVLVPFVASASAPLALAEEAPVEAVTEQEVVETLVTLNRKAVGQYRAHHHAEAHKLLLEALVLAEQHDLGRHDITARTHVHLGIVAIAQGKTDEGREQFARALRLRPDIKLTKQLATAKLKQEFEAARGRPEEPAAPAPEPAASAAPAAAPAPAEAAGAEPATDKEPVEAAARGRTVALSTRNVPGHLDEADEPDLPASVPQPLYCPTPMEGPPAADVRLHCLTQADVRAKKIVLYYRPGDGEQYTPVRMSRTKKGWYSAIIPARQVTGNSLQFYFEARTDANRLAAANGKVDLPNVIVLKPGAPPVGVGALAALTFSDGKDDEAAAEEEETPLQMRAREEEIAAEERSHARRPAGRFWVGLGVGTGYGWHLKRPLENHDMRQVTAGFSPLGLGHATPEVGYQVTERLSLSLQGRIQYLPTSGSGDVEAGAKGPARSAYAALARAQYAFVQAGDVQLLATLSAGYGSALRMHIPAEPSQNLISSDTVVAGPVAAGPGAVVAYNFTNRILAALEARSLVGFPKLGALLELTAGLQYAF